MITEKVIREIYKKYSTPPKNREELKIDYFVKLLRNNHTIIIDNDTIYIEDIEEGNPFNKIVISGLNAIIELEKKVAFVMQDHIIFFNKNNNGLHIHFRTKINAGFLKRFFCLKIYKRN